MRVIENTATRLSLRVIPWGAAALLGGVTLLFFLWGAALFNAGEPKGGAALIGIGAIFFVGCFGVFVKVLTVTLDRTRAEAEVIERGVFGAKRKTFSMVGMTGATLQSMVIKRKPGDLAEKGRKGHKNTPEPRVWRVAFARGTAPPQPLTDVYGNEKTARAIGGAINGWFARPE